MGILDLIFPKYCINCKKLGSYLCATCFSYLSFDAEGLCVVCNRASIDSLTHPRCRGKYTIDGVFTSLVYKGVAKKLIYNFKYNPYLTDLRKILCDLFYESLIQKEEFHNVLNSQKLVIVPVPLYSSRERQRGYNQAELLAKGLSKKFSLPVLNLLKRAKKTSSQITLTKKERKENIKGAFAISHNALGFEYPNAFLVDDVLTTGSTLIEATKVLKKSGVKGVWGLTLVRD